MEMNGDSDGVLAHLDHHERYRPFDYLIPAHIVDCTMPIARSVQGQETVEDTDLKRLERGDFHSVSSCVFPMAAVAWPTE